MKDLTCPQTIYAELPEHGYDSDEERWEHAYKLSCINAGKFSDRLKALYQEFPSEKNVPGDRVTFCAWAAPHLGVNTIAVYRWYEGRSEPSYFVQHDMIEVLKTCLKDEIVRRNKLYGK